MAICSFSQNREDVLLARALPGRTGFYIDVGAADPVEHSVTKHFYDLGWSGINVEPQAGFFERLQKDRPRDRNIQAVLSDRPGTLTLHAAPTHPGYATTDPQVMQGMRQQGIAVTPIEVPAYTLADVCEKSVSGEIDFLKIDVEGAEQRVLAGGDFRRWRPKVVLVEATEQGSSNTNHKEWEPILLENDYLFATFDGLNRYYVRAESADLAAILQVPVNVFDDWYPYEYARRIQELEAEAADQRRTAVQFADKASQQFQTIEAILRRLEELKRALTEAVR